MKTMKKQWLVAFGTIGLGACMGLSEVPLEEDVGALDRDMCMDDSSRFFDECANARCPREAAMRAIAQRRCIDDANEEYWAAIDRIKRPQPGRQQDADPGPFQQALAAAGDARQLKVAGCQAQPVDADCAGHLRSSGLLGLSRENNTWFIGELLWGEDATGCWLEAEHTYSRCRKNCGTPGGGIAKAGETCAPFQLERDIVGVFGVDEGFVHHISLDWLACGSFDIQTIDEEGFVRSPDGEDVSECICSPDTSACAQVDALHLDPNNWMYVPHGCDDVAKEANGGVLPAGADYRYTPQIEIDESCGAPVAATRVCRAWKIDADGRERPFGPAAIRPTPQPCNPSSQAQSQSAQQSCQ